MPRVFVSGTILAGQSLSAPLDCRSGVPLLLFLPVQWTASRLSYQLSPDGVTFWDLYDRSAREIAVNIRPGTVVQFNPEWFANALGCWVKIRSGSSDGPIVQTVNRDFKMLIET